MAYHHLTERERYHIEIYLNKHFSLRKIAIALWRSVSTVTREIARCEAAGFECYVADYKYKTEKVINKKAYKLKGKLLKTVKFLLKKKFSPEQISGWLWVKKGIKISHQAIYNWIYLLEIIALFTQWVEKNKPSRLRKEYRHSVLHEA